MVVGGGEGVESRPVDVGGSLQKGPFMATKWAQNGVILVGLGLSVYTSSSVGRLCFHRKNAHRLCFIFGGGGGGGEWKSGP